MRVENSSARVGLPGSRGLRIDGTLVRLREKKMADARNDFRWQSDPELARLDATNPIRLPFSVYLLDYSIELRSPAFKRFPLAIETLDGGRHIGNTTIYDIDEKNQEAQLGILIGDRDYWCKGYGTDAVSTVSDYIFHTTTIRRLYLKTLEWNTRAQASFAKSGFVPTGRLERHSYSFRTMDLTREHWLELGRDGSGPP